VKVLSEAQISTIADLLFLVQTAVKVSLVQVALTVSKEWQGGNAMLESLKRTKR
jgi:hypothetical protein